MLNFFSAIGENQLSVYSSLIQIPLSSEPSEVLCLVPFQQDEPSGIKKVLCYYVIKCIKQCLADQK